MVSKIFSGLIPMMIVLAFFGVVSMLCQIVFGMDVMAITENMNAFAACDPIPNILTYSFYVFCQMGGSGCCLPLIVDTFLFSKDKAKRAEEAAELEAA